MSLSERCGRDYEHFPHHWREGDQDLYCDGHSDLIESWDAHERQDADYERGMYH